MKNNLAKSKDKGISFTIITKGKALKMNKRGSLFGWFIFIFFILFIFSEMTEPSYQDLAMDSMMEQEYYRDYLTGADYEGYEQDRYYDYYEDYYDSSIK